MGLRREEDGESERSFVRKETGVAPPGNMTPRASGQTSVWSFITRTHDYPTQEEKQMTGEIPSTQEEGKPAGASSHTDDHGDALPWYRTQRHVRRLQARIGKATQEKRWGKLKARPRLFTHSLSGKALAVRRVTENQGKKTPGIDQVLWDTPEKKAQARRDLRHRGYHPQPLRRVSIPKSHGARRPLSMPTMKDRAMQALSLWALQPGAETLADPHSYGFRPQRCTADALVYCHILFSQKNGPNWALEGDRQSCCDKISHEWL